MPRKKIQERYQISRKQRTEILASCGNRCARCGKRFTWDATIEHVIPLSKGGTYDPENLVALCKKCNQEKSDDIVNPAAFYSALSPERRKKLQHMIDRYCKTTDWLDETHLFQTDQFTMPVMLMQGCKALARVEKLRRREVLEFMAAYQAKLGAVPTAPDTEFDVAHPFYRIILQEKTVMVISPYIIRHHNGLNLNTYTENMLIRNTTCYLIVMDIFVNPEINDRKKFTTELLANINGQIMKEIATTLKRKGAGVTMPILITAHQNDKFAERAIRELNRRMTLMFNNTQHLDNGRFNGEIAGRDPKEYLTFSKLLGDTETWSKMAKQTEDAVNRAKRGEITKQQLVDECALAYFNFWKNVEDRIQPNNNELTQKGPDA